MNTDKMNVDKYLCVTNEAGQPILNEDSKLIYYCKDTGALTVFDDEQCDVHMNENNNEAEKDVINTKSTNQKIQDQKKEKILEINEDKFTHEMTIKLLEIIEAKFHLLNDKMHSKKKIWTNIAIEMQNNGYFTSYKETKIGDKCNQRWRNLEKMYYGHCRYMKSTGTGKKKPPKYFDEMHELIGEKHSSQPVNLLDSLQDFNAASFSCETYTSSKTNNEDINSETRYSKDNNEEFNMKDVSGSTNKENKNNDSQVSNIFENVKKSVRPKKENLSVVLKELQEQEMQVENKRFEQFQALLVEQNELKKKTLEQRNELLNILKTLINVESQKKSNKKRKHYSSDSD